MARLLKLTTALAALLALAGYWLYSVRPAPPRHFEVTRQQAPFIPTGTVIGSGPPAGWTHLIVKSRPQPGAGDVHASGDGGAHTGTDSPDAGRGSG